MIIAQLLNGLVFRSGLSDFVSVDVNGTCVVFDQRQPLLDSSAIGR
jgi:hypothetical protein